MLLDVRTAVGYDIATALRGPDVRGLGFKALFTCPLRAMVGIMGGMPDNIAIVGWERWTYVDASSVRAAIHDAPDHAVAHMELALRHLTHLREGNMLYSVLINRIGDDATLGVLVETMKVCVAEMHNIPTVRE